MDIGNQLKNTRVLLGLTQEQFSAGIVTESFYSRVENNKSNISMNALLGILNYHHVSLRDLFAKEDIKHQKKQIMQAFIDRDVKKLNQYFSSSELTGSKYQLEFKLMFAILNQKIDSLSKKTKEEAYHQLLRIGKLNEEALFNLNLLIPIIEFTSLKGVIDYVVNSADINKIDSFSLQLLDHSLLSFVKRCFEENEQVEARKILIFLEKIPRSSNLFLEQLLVNAYRYLLEKKKEKLNNITSILNLSGYETYADELTNLAKQ